MILGAHCSVAGGPANAFGNAAEMTAQAMQVFVKPPRKLRGVKPFSAQQVHDWEAARAASGVQAIVVHANYLINLAGEGHVAEYSREAFLDEMKRCHELGIGALIFHPGQHLDAGVDKGVRNIAAGLAWCLRRGKDYADVTLVLENMAGQGSMVGFELEQLRAIVDLAGQPERFGYCLDTCHLLASGYDLRTADAYAKTMEQVDEVLGVGNVKAFHVNDSRLGLGSKVDRHEAIGKGKLGDAAFWHLVHDARFARVPGVLETPHDDNAGFKKDLQRLRKLEQSSKPPKAGLDKFS